MLKTENGYLRKCFIKNIREYNKRDLYEREVDEIYADFNKAANENHNFIS